MTTITEQYADLLKRSQDDALAALKAWNRTMQRAFGQLPTTGRVSPEHVIDEVYDFAGHVLDAQREFARQFIATSTAAADKLRTGLSPRAAAVTSEAVTSEAVASEAVTSEAVTSEPVAPEAAPETVRPEVVTHKAATVKAAH